MLCNARLLAFGSVVLLATATFHVSAAPVHGTQLGKVVCKSVKQHGKKTRTCSVVIPKPTATPTPPPVPFTSHAVTLACDANSKGTGCGDLHFSLTNNGKGTTTFAQKELGYTLEMSRFGIVLADTSAGPDYYLTMYVEARKGVPRDGALDSWQPSDSSFSVTAANGHPYSVSTCRIPPFPGIPLYNGEHEGGWVCSHAIRKEYMNTTFTWSVELEDRFVVPSPYETYTFPLVAVSIHAK